LASSALEGRYSQVIHPLHAVLLAGSAALFLGAAASDLAYFRTYEIQWSNFSSWLIAGGLLLAGGALLCALADLARRHRRVRGSGRYAVVLAATWVAGLLNALVHARDGWATMPTGLVLSVAVIGLALAATWLGFADRRDGGPR